MHGMYRNHLHITQIYTLPTASSLAIEKLFLDMPVIECSMTKLLLGYCDFLL